MMNKLTVTGENYMRDRYSWNDTQVDGARLSVKEFANFTQRENDTFEEEYIDYIFDCLGIRILFIVLYSIVFCGCVFGNLILILLMLLTRRLKSTTNFFLTSLAFADLCVGIFCVFQNLAFYLITTWVFGDFLCKMNQFIHGLSCTASIIILVVISVERYLAVIHPIRCKQILTRNRVRIIVLLIWIISMAYSMPRYLISHTISNPLSGSFEIICIMSRIRYNSKLFDIINFILLYLIPLGIMTILYSLIAVRLWNSGWNNPTSRKFGKPNSVGFCEETASENGTRIVALDKRNMTYIENRRTVLNHNMNHCQMNHFTPRQLSTTCYRSSKNVLRARRRVIRMLTTIVLAFAICNLPFHARKMWQYWSSEYDGTSTFSSLFTPITFLCTYCNSLINPLVYAFLSKNFQKSFKEFVTCRWRDRNHSRQVSFRRKSRRSMTRSYSNNG